MTRIIFLADYRIPHAIMSMHFDHYLQGIDRTVIASPVPQAKIMSAMASHGIDFKYLTFVDDSVIYDLYPEVNHWVFEGDYRGWWLRQQAIKLAYLDYINDDVMLMHDPDTFVIEPYHCYKDDQLNYLAIFNETHDSYRGVLESVLGIERQTPHCFVSELVPCMGQDIKTLKLFLEQRHNKHWLDAIIEAVPGMPTVPPWGTGNIIKWFSEYEFIGNWTMTQRPINFQQQRRFEYQSLNQLTQLSRQYNSVCDAIPNLRDSLQFDWNSMKVVDFDHWYGIINRAIQQ